MANLEIHLPKELTIRPQPLITLAGLDSKRNADHRIIADAFTLNRRSDRLPLNFQVRPIDHDYPHASPPVSNETNYAEGCGYFRALME